MPSPTTHTLLLQLRQILDEKCEPAEAARRHQQRPGRGTSGGGGGAKRGGSEPYPGHESVASAGGRGAIAELELTQHAMAELFTSLATASPIVVYRRVHRPRDLLRSRLASYLESVFGANSSSVKAKILDPPSVLLHTFTSAVNCLQVRVGVRVRSGHSPPLAPSRELVSMGTGLGPPAPPTPRPALLPPLLHPTPSSPPRTLTSTWRSSCAPRSSPKPGHAPRAGMGAQRAGPKGRERGRVEVRSARLGRGGWQRRQR